MLNAGKVKVPAIGLCTRSEKTTSLYFSDYTKVSHVHYLRKLISKISRRCGATVGRQTRHIVGTLFLPNQFRLRGVAITSRIMSHLRQRQAQTGFIL
jgi:hypothetical protein